MSSDVPWRADITDEQLELANGALRIPDGPGLGMEVREEELDSPASAAS